MSLYGAKPEEPYPDDWYLPLAARNGIADAMAVEEEIQPLPAAPPPNASVKGNGCGAFDDAQSQTPTPKKDKSNTARKKDTKDGTKRKPSGRSRSAVPVSEDERDSDIELLRYDQLDCDDNELEELEDELFVKLEDCAVSTLLRFYMMTTDCFVIDS
jgi:hypothetical protein